MSKELFIKLFRFTIAGIVSVVVNLVFLYIFDQWLGIWYLTASILAFLISIASHFYLQKVWVFTSTGKDEATNQFFLFFLLAMINLALNSALMYILVDGLLVNYLVAETIIRILLAVLNYFMYEKIVFRKNLKHEQA